MRKLVLFAIPFGLATLVCVYLLSAVAALILGGIAVVACIVFCLLRRKTGMAILVAGLAVGFLWSAGYELLLLQPVWNADGTKQNITATVCGYPVKTESGCKIETELSINGRTAKTQLFLYDEMLQAEPGDTVLVSAKLQKTEPSQEDFSDTYSLSVGYVLRAFSSKATVEKCPKVPLRFLPVRFAHRLCESVSEAAPQDVAGFLQALVTGDKSGLSEQIRNEISDAGFSHIIAVSGMHVSILLGAIYLLTRKTPLLSALLGIPLTVFFVLMTGGTASVVRAGVMQVIVLLAPLLRRETDGLTSICAAMLVILLGNPNAAANVSFQLSFGAIAGIFLCSAKIYAFLSKPSWVSALLKNRWTKPITFFVCSCISSTLGALLLTVPLTALHFGSVAIYSLLSNLLVLGAVSFCFVGGLLTGLLGLLWLPGARLLGWVIAWPVRYILWVAGSVSKLPFASLSATTPYISIWLLFVYVFVTIAFLQKGEKTVLLTVVCILVSLSAALMFTRLDARSGDACITVLDVGQGECVFLRSGEFSAMVDCGGSDGYAAASTASNHVRFAASGELDCLLLTHYDADHVNGVEALLSQIAVDTLYLPDVDDGGKNRVRLEAAARQTDTKIVYVTQDISLDFEGGSMQLFAPVSHYDDNSACLSVLFSAFEYDMLMTGDMDFYSEYDLMLTHTLPDVELFIAGHHGSATSSSVELLDLIQPETVIISVGKNNRYGHPTQEALARFAAVGAAVYRTDECGSITVCW